LPGAHARGDVPLLDLVGVLQRKTRMALGQRLDRPPLLFGACELVGKASDDAR
jgi:hypothetical protein